MLYDYVKLAGGPQNISAKGPQGHKLTRSPTGSPASILTIHTARPPCPFSSITSGAGDATSGMVLDLLYGLRYIGREWMGSLI